MRSDSKWIIVLVAFDDADVEPCVIKERIEAHEDPRLAAFLRGGELVDVMEERSEAAVEAARVAVEKKCIR